MRALKTIALIAAVSAGGLSCAHAEDQFVNRRLN